MSKLPKPPAQPLPGAQPPPAPADAPAAELSSPADPNKVEGAEPPAVIDTLTAPAPSSSQDPVSGSITLPPTTPLPEAGLSAVNELLLTAEDEPEAPEAKPEDKGKEKPTDTVKVPPLAPPRQTRVEETKAPAPSSETDEEEIQSVTPTPEAGPNHIASRSAALALLLILVLLVGGFVGHLLTKKKPVVVEKEKVVTVTKKVPGPTKEKVVEKTVEVKAPPVKKVHRPSRTAPAEKEITFKAEDLVHVWTGPVDHLLDKDED